MKQDLLVCVPENLINTVLEKAYLKYCNSLQGETNDFYWKITDEKAGYPVVDFSKTDGVNMFRAYVGVGVRFGQTNADAEKMDIFRLEAKVVLSSTGSPSLTSKDALSVNASYSKDPASKKILEEALPYIRSGIDAFLKKLVIPKLDFGIELKGVAYIVQSGYLFLSKSMSGESGDIPDLKGQNNMKIYLTSAMMTQVLQQNLKNIKTGTIKEKSLEFSGSINPKYETIFYSRDNKVMVDASASGIAKYSGKPKIDLLPIAKNMKLTFTFKTENNAIKVNIGVSDFDFEFVPLPTSSKIGFALALLLASLASVFKSIGSDVGKIIANMLKNKYFMLPNIPPIALDSTQKVMFAPLFTSITISSTEILLQANINMEFK